ncbi:unnamed protein product [Litomosoides sigmodontis]|uniref:Intraflagellar transport protein 57 homolog n=1 Tax=Litomosoides sigmodontis TaxID=42156 RepID=A0A3P6TSC3_LITSI|nr:unnamed protein product [Litomosoides sigmodontis]
MEDKEDEEEAKKENGQKGKEQSPSQQYDLYIISDELNDKLKLLNYEEDYANLATSYRTISREYFIKSKNIGEQFFIFTTLAAWLIQKSIDPTFAFPHECDDPNETISNILDALKSKNIPITFAPNKLKSGAGEQCLYVLDKLADLALIANRFSWTKADPTAEDDKETDEAVDQAEITAEEFDEDDQIDVADDDDNEIVMDLTAMPSSTSTDDKNQQPLDGILHSNIDVNSWKLEVERVAPRLKVTFEHDSKDWRMHLEKIRSLQKTVAELLSTTEPHLTNISNELGKTMERIASSREVSGDILERTQKLQRVSDELEQIKQQIDERSLRNSDGAPMLRLKQALKKMESEILTMNVQISIIEQSLLQSQLKQRTAYNAYFQDLHI